MMVQDIYVDIVALFLLLNNTDPRGPHVWVCGYKSRGTRPIDCKPKPVTPDATDCIYFFVMSQST
jgi:hypothetical protein